MDGMSLKFPPVTDAIFERGFAVGSPNVKDDTMSFRFREEVFEFPTLEVHRFAKWNGYWYEARIEDLRKLKAETAGG